MLARTVLGTLRSSNWRERDGLSTRRSPGTKSSGCYYETIYIQGGNTLGYRGKMGTTLFWNTLGDYVDANRHQLVSTATLLRTLDDATPLDLAGLLLAARFPRIY